MRFTFQARGPVLLSILALALAIPAGQARAQSGSDDARSAAHAAQPRFFTINEVLAKRDGSRRAAARGRLASAPAASATDAGIEPQRRLSGEPFGLQAFRAPEGRLWEKWRRVEAELASEAEAIAACQEADPDQCSLAAQQFLRIVEQAKQQDGSDRLLQVNRAVNAAIRYVSDFEQHGVADRWSAPLVSLQAGMGDCEDYAIAKYAVLRKAGMAEDDLRLILLRDTLARVDHAVLAARQDGRWLVLDNRRNTLAEPGELAHYLPLFALSHEGVQLYAAPYASWGERDSEFAHWRLRGRDGGEIAEFAGWPLRETMEPAAAK